MGDIVGYGPFPNECVQLIKKYSDITIAGNHDHAAAGIIDLEYFNIYAKNAMEWTIHNMTDENKDFIRGLPLTVSVENSYLVHAAPMNPEKWGYIFTPYQAQLNFDYFSENYCFIGHSHIPIIFKNNPDKEPTTLYNTELEFQPDSKYIINVGSVGQPRDHLASSAFGILDTDTHSFRFERVEYDVYSTQKAMMARDFPEFLIERLKYGR